MKRLTLPILAMAAACSSAEAGRPAYQNPDLPVEVRVADLLGRMTIEEKVAQMLSMWQAKSLITDEGGNFDPTGAPEWFRVGIGRIERPSDGHGARASAEWTNAIQQWVMDNTRLQIPVLFHEEALHGLQGPEATSFPQSIALASAWDTALVRRIFLVAAREVRARGAQQVLAPVVDVAREPRWGRIEETYGEDPFLVAQLGLAAVRGFQGDVADGRVGPQNVIATLKHMTGHGQPEAGTNVGPAPFGERTLRSFFFPPFELAVKEGGALSLMASYNEIDGIPSHANTWMLRDVLREEWGFEGTIVSDWNAVRDLIDRHHLTADTAEAATMAIEATVDIELPDVQTYHTLVEQVRAGVVPESDIDRIVGRLLTAKFITGLFENPFVDPDSADAISGSESARPLALEAARKSIVLLKNEGGMLPLDPAAARRVAVIGPHAAEVLLGGYAGTPRYAVSILEGIQTRLGESATVRYAEGVRITEDSTFTDEPQPHMGGTRAIRRWNGDRVVLADPEQNRARIREAVALARQSDVAIVVVGDNEMTSREGWSEAHLGDRPELTLVGEQEELVLAILATGTPTVVVLNNGRPLAIPEIDARAPAILEAWYLGQETGAAVAEALFGDLNPSGKLPVTFARSVGQLPVYYNRLPSARRGYLFESAEPLYPFGYGLSYTTFEYGEPSLSSPSIPVDGRVTVTVEVRNTGTRAGDEIVQLYIRDVVSRATRPVKELKGFQRVSLQPGEARQLSFELGARELEYWGPEMRRVVEPGTFEIMVGGSSVAVKSTTLEVVP